MLVPLDRASRTLADYLTAELDHITDPVRRFGYKFAVGAMSANPSTFGARAKELGVLNDSGMIDTEAVRSGFAGAFAGCGSFSFLGLTFSQADADELLRRMEM